MNREEILSMAKESGFVRTKITPAYFKFAALVAANERESCAVVADKHDPLGGTAQAIRSRGAA